MTHVYGNGIPLSGLTPQDRKYNLTVHGAPSWGPMRDNDLIRNGDSIWGLIRTLRGEPGNRNYIRHSHGLSHAEISG